MADKVSVIGTGEQFTTLQAWMDDIETNGLGLYSDGDVAVAQVKENLNAATGHHLTVANAPASTIVGARIEPTAGNAHGGVIGGGIVLSLDHFSSELINGVSGSNYDFEIRDLELRHNNASASSTSYLFYWNSSGTEEVVVKRCLIYPATTGAQSGIYDANMSHVIAVRCAVFGCLNGIQAAEMYNNSVSAEGGSFSYGGSTSPATNNIGMDAVTNDYAGSWSSPDKNMSADNTAPGTTNYRGETSTLIFTDPVNRDLTLLPGTNAIGNGNDLGTSYDANIDITGATVTGTWNLGAYQSGAGPGPSPGGFGPVLRTHGL